MLSSKGSSQPRDQTHVSSISFHWQVVYLPLVPPGKPQRNTWASINYQMVRHFCLVIQNVDFEEKDVITVKPISVIEHQVSFTCFTNIFVFNVHHDPSFPGVSYGKESADNAGELGSIPGSGRSPGEGNGNVLQYSCLENPLDRGAWRVQSMGSQRIRHDWATNIFTFFHIPAS